MFTLMRGAGAAVVVGLACLLLIGTGFVGKELTRGYGFWAILFVGGGVLLGLLGLAGLIVGGIWRVSIGARAAKARRLARVTKEQLNDTFEGAAECVLRARSATSGSIDTKVFGTYELPEFPDRTTSDDEDTADAIIARRREILGAGKTALTAVPLGWRAMYENRGMSKPSAVSS